MSFITHHSHKAYNLEDRVRYLPPHQVCYDVEVPTCSANQCGTGGCPLGQSVCSQNQYNTQTLCPENYPGPGLGPMGLARPLAANIGVRIVL